MADIDRTKWQRRHAGKAAIRAEIWTYLETSGIGIAPIRDHIPNFHGAEAAAAHLASAPFWGPARIVKCNPDPPQIPVRRRALEDGKLLYAPIPNLSDDLPFVELDPEDLARRNISFADAAVAEVFVEVGRRVRFQEMKPMDVLCVGCVAVTRTGGRTGKGAGFADLELGIFRALNLIATGAPLVTTVHSSQVVDEAGVIMQAHDSPLHYIATQDELIATHTAITLPAAIDWDRVQPDQFEAIPFLRQLRAELAS
ncbi:MAG: 5-formyltetrahydrofolate cyclo-ligase [Ancalomicrobiaceae bacterium]|nr:5-formyltetrahydrofolate cyclo-ligase [Ancalomicrobiaceae bacterium]